MNKITLLSATALVMSSPGALVAETVPPAPVSSWTGLHIGIGGGAGYNTYDAESLFDVDAWNAVVPDFIDIESDEDKFYGFGTVEIGADYQFDGTAIVVGILASYDFNGKSEVDSSLNSAAEDGYITAEIQSELEDSWFVGGRAGFVVNGASLLYGLGGYSWTKAKVKSHLGFDFNGAGDDFAQIDEDESVDGWTLGVGLEQLLTDSISLKLEYRHDFLDSVKWNGAPFDPEWGGVDPDNNASGKVDFSRDTLRAVVSWRFGMSGP